MPRLLRTEKAPPPPPPPRRERIQEVERGRRGGFATAVLGLVVLLALLAGGFWALDLRSNGALGTEILTSLQPIFGATVGSGAIERAPPAEPFEMASSAPAADGAAPYAPLADASAPHAGPADAASQADPDLRPRLSPQSEPSQDPAAAAKAPPPPPARAEKAPPPPARAERERAPAALAPPSPRTEKAAAPAAPPAARPARLVLGPQSTRPDAPPSATPAAAPGDAGVVQRLERCLGQLINYCPRGEGGHGGFAEDGVISSAERRFLNQRALFGWSEVSDANVENCQRHVQAAARAGGSRSYQPLVTACGTLPIAGPDR
jgi:hypothetical protein